MNRSSTFTARDNCPGVYCHPLISPTRACPDASNSLSNKLVCGFMHLWKMMHEAGVFIPVANKHMRCFVNWTRTNSLLFAFFPFRRKKMLVCL
jgi:hypothetical protein